jgi:hypothetical protein
MIYRFIMKEVKESQNYNFSIDKEFPWGEEIDSLANQVLEKSNHLKGEFEYNRHKGDGFEFNIKSRVGPDVDYLSDKYGYSDEEIYDMWDQFLADNLQTYGDDIVENSGYFDDWYQEGRSGGWLLLKHKSPLINDPESVIDDEIFDLNYTIENLEEDYFDIFIEGIEISKIIKLIIKRGIEGDLVNDLKKKSDLVISGLKEHLSELKKLESELEGVQGIIKNFWEKAEEYFNDYVEDEHEWRESN